MSDENRDVLAALRERRHPDGSRGHPAEQRILRALRRRGPARLNALERVDVECGGGDDPYVGRDALAAGCTLLAIVEQPHEHAVYHTYVVQAEARERLVRYLAERGIGTAVHYPVPIHLQSVAASLERAGYEVVLSKSTSQGASAKQLERIARRSDAHAVVTGRVRRQGMRLWTVALHVSDADGAAVPGSDIDFKSSWLPGLAKELTDTASKRLEAVLGRAEGPLDATAEAML